MSLTIKHTSPPRPLAPFVHRFWEVAAIDETRMRVLPDGSWDIVLFLTPTTVRIEFVGPMTKAIIVPLKPSVHYGIRFQPGTYFKPLQFAMAQFKDKTVPLSTFVPAPKINRKQPIIPQLIAFAQELHAQGWLVRDDKLDAALAIMRRQSLHEQPLLNAFTAKGYGLRTIERKFHQYVGLRPKQFMRIDRQLAVVGSLLLQKEPNLGSLAAEFNYVDQAHMSNDIRLLSGTTPQLLKNEYDDFLQYDWPYHPYTNDVN